MEFLSILGFGEPSPEKDDSTYTSMPSVYNPPIIDPEYQAGRQDGGVIEKAKEVLSTNVFTGIYNGYKSLFDWAFGNETTTDQTGGNQQNVEIKPSGATSEIGVSLVALVALGGLIWFATKRR